MEGHTRVHAAAFPLDWSVDLSSLTVGFIVGKNTRLQSCIGVLITGK